MKNKIKIIKMIPIRIAILVLLGFWIGIFKSLVIYGESHFYEPNVFIASIELVMVSICFGYYFIKSIKEITHPEA